jgi:hypothetical protein
MILVLRRDGGAERCRCGRWPKFVSTLAGLERIGNGEPVGGLSRRLCCVCRRRSGIGIIHGDDV